MNGSFLFIVGYLSSVDNFKTTGNISFEILDRWLYSGTLNVPEFTKGPNFSGFQALTPDSNIFFPGLYVMGGSDNFNGGKASFLNGLVITNDKSVNEADVGILAVAGTFSFVKDLHLNVPIVFGINDLPCLITGNGTFYINQQLTFLTLATIDSIPVVVSNSTAVYSASDLVLRNSSITFADSNNVIISGSLSLFSSTADVGQSSLCVYGSFVCDHSRINLIIPAQFTNFTTYQIGQQASFQTCSVYVSNFLKNWPACIVFMTYTTLVPIAAPKLFISSLPTNTQNVSVGMTSTQMLLYAGPLPTPYPILTSPPTTTFYIPNYSSASTPLISTLTFISLFLLTF